MSEEEKERKVDRTGWGEGPWDGEPDKLVWKTKAGLPGMIVRNEFGALCGYAAVAKGHPLYGQSYDGTDLSAHGGLTYADKCAGNICHVPEPGEPDDVWWFGFDCNHAFDLAPGMRAHMRKIGAPRSLDPEYDVYRDLAYVKEEVESLAEQLAKAVA